MITPEQVRDWVAATGSFAPLVFLVLKVAVTVTPFPRFVFTVGAGLLFGPVLGIGLAVVAATVSAGLAFVVVRAVGRDRVATRLTHPAVRAVDRRLARRGWLAVGSLRLIAPVPFSVVNYCAGLSSVRLSPFLVATAVGIVPSTVGAVLVGDALVDGADPVLLTVSAVCLAVGVVGLVVDARLRVPDEDRAG